jgi:hypothetical protein
MELYDASTEVATEMGAIKALAKSRGIRWVDVKAMARDLRALESFEREQDREIRQSVWRRYMYTAHCIEFWRHGMQRRFPHAFGDGDRDSIPGFDCVAKTVASEFPQFDCEDPAESVWNYIAADYIRAKSAAEIHRDALEALSAGATVTTTTDSEVPF